jgi:two-component system LytT family response regulator
MRGSILIADDEPLARRTLRQHLVDLGWAGPILEAGDGKTATVLANGKRPDLLFLDIVMPGATGLEVLERLDYEPKVIFTTAHGEYAVAAFELGVLDYVLKPFGRDRLEQVLRRAQAARDGLAAPLLSRAKESLEHIRPLSRIFVRDGGKIIPITLANLERAQAADDYVTLHVGAKDYLVGVRLADLEEHLSTKSFLRIHRSHLINLDHIVAIEQYDGARVQVAMRSGAKIIASRGGSKRLRDLAL